MVSTMADQIYGIHQSQPRDVYNYLKSNSARLDIVGHFNYLPNLQSRAQGGVVGIPLGLELVVSDKIFYYDEPMMDGRVRRYAKIEAYFAFFGGVPRASYLSVVQDQLVDLGYSDILSGPLLDTATSYAADLGVPSAAIDSVGFNSAQKIYIRAGLAGYVNAPSSVMDAPYDGTSYIRLNGEWVQDDHLVHAVIDGGTATLNGAALSSPSPTPTPSPSSVLFNFTPSYTFDGNGYDSSYQNYTYGEEPCDTFGIEEIDISNSFLTIYFKTTADRLSWSAVDRSVSIQSIAGSYDWEGAQVLSDATTYSTNTSSNYIHYELGLTSSQKGELADFVSSAGIGNTVITLELS